MTEETIKTLREHIVFLATALENQRHQDKYKTALLKRMMDPEDLGHAVSNEVRKLAYQILIDESQV